jgi:hypothetical protein
MAWKIYDYRDRRQANIINAWLKGLQKPERIRMQKRIDLLRDNGHELCPGLAGPLKESRHLYKIRVNGRVAPRLFFCKGPITIESEYTLLWGAFETDDELPEGTIEVAEQNRLEVIANSERRCVHERVTP